MIPVRRRDLPPHRLPAVQIHIVERQLRSMNIQPTHDRHYDLPDYCTLPDSSGGRGRGRHIPSW